MKRNSLMLSVLILTTITTSFPAHALSDDKVKASSNDDVADVAKAEKKKESPEKAEKQTKNEETKVDSLEKTKSSENSVESFNNGLSSLVSEIMEDEILQEEDQGQEDLK